jgi:hypothetical protein
MVEMSPRALCDQVCTEFMRSAAEFGLLILQDAKHGNSQRTIEALLYSGDAINLTLSFSVDVGGCIQIDYAIFIRWENAEKLRNTIYQSAPDDKDALPPSVKKARKARFKFPIAYLTVSYSNEFFLLTSPAIFKIIDASGYSAFISHLFEVAINKIVPQFSCYGNAAQFALACLAPKNESKIEFGPIPTLLVILASADRKNEYEKCRLEAIDGELTDWQMSMIEALSHKK